MARMMPSITSGTRSPGELELFRRLREDPDTADWVVLHSLDLAEHRSQLQGEIDFVILVPSLGVLCLEVKSATTVKRSDDGDWKLGSDPRTTSPFKQASEGMHSLRQQLKNAQQGLANVLFYSAVAFTGVTFAVKRKPIEWHEWQVIDRPQLDLHPISHIIRGVLTRAREFTARSPSATWFRPDSGRPTHDDIEGLVTLLRPSFEFFESPRSRRLQLRTELKIYTDEQTRALDALSGAGRVFFRGPAGTGKTLLAREAARRSAEEGRKTLFCCFNRAIAEENMREMGASRSDALWVGTFHGLLLEIDGFPDVPEEPVRRRQFFRHELPERVLDMLTRDGGISRKFDTLVVDEAQDLLSQPYLDVMEALVQDGLTRGVWRFFGDLERQALYESELSPAGLVEGESRLLRSGIPYELTHNCRNTPRIGEWVISVTDLRAYRGFLRPDDGRDVLQYYYSNEEEALRFLELALEQYREAFQLSDIVILSPKVNGLSARLTDPWRQRLRPLASPARTGISVSTIQAFKGLESPAVILTDIESVRGPLEEALVYVGGTRATSRLAVIASKAASQQVQQRLLG